MRSVRVDGFWMDERPVTAADYRRFVRETGYVTVAERLLDPDDYPDADPGLLVPGALVFRATAGPVPLDDYRTWWEYVLGAFWKRPGGPGRRSTDATAIRSSRWPSRTPRPTPPGPARSFRPRPSGSTRPAAASRGGLRLGRRALPGREAGGEHLAGLLPVGEPEARRLRRAPRRSGASRPTATASST